MLEVFAGDVELRYCPFEIRNTDIIQVCHIDFLNGNSETDVGECWSSENSYGRVDVNLPLGLEA